VCSALESLERIGILIFGLIMLAITAATGSSAAPSPTADDLQADLQTAYACKEIDGRKVWKGGLAYYIQSYVYDGQSTDDATDIATDAVLPADNSPETMHEFEQACLTLAPTAINGN
jgi:hypothetical protein